MTQIPRIGPFRLHQILGQGGMGTVWAGQHEAQGLPVAVKILSERFSDHSWFLSSFATEVRAVARLSHPNIVRVLDHGVVGEDARQLQGRGVGSRSPWLAMEQVAGAPLSQLRGQLDWPTLARIFSQLLAALAHAHARGVLHRDIKPGNIIVGDERVVLLDFGIARVGDTPGAGPDGDEDEEVVGTAAYMAPEQFSGRAAELGPWTDLYALGCTAWAAITGDAPFGRNRPLAHIRDDHFAPAAAVLDAPMALPPGCAPGWAAWRRTPPAAYPARRRRGFRPEALPALSEAPTFLGPGSVEALHPGDRPGRGRHPAARAPSAAARHLARGRNQRPYDEAGGAGLRLFWPAGGALVGREEQRDALWQAAAVEGGQPAAPPAGLRVRARAPWLPGCASGPMPWAPPMCCRPRGARGGSAG